MVDKTKTTKDECRSRKGNVSQDIKKVLKTEKPKASAVVAVNGETFRQQMYDEYVHKVLEREERKHHKVVKISTHEDICKPSELKKIGMSAVEKEFIEKARNRLNKFGINLDESEPETESGEKATGAKRRDDEEENTLTAKCLIDGKEFEDARQLPKHLREFLQISATSAAEDGEFRRIEDCCVIRRFSIALNLPSAQVFRLILDLKNRSVGD